MSNVKELNVNNQTYDIVGKAVEDQNNSGTPVKVWTGTKAEYDLLAPDANTIYNITDDENPTTYANTSLSNLDPTGQAVIDSKVNKSGDTMTGTLNIEESTGLKLVNPDIVKGTNPTETKYTVIEFNDSTNDEDFTKTRLGVVYNMIDTSGTSNTIIAANRFVASNADNAQIVVTEKADGTKSCSFPNTDCVEGQFVKKDVTVASGVSLNGSSNATYTLSDLPNDGNNYLVWINVEAVTGSTSGNYINVKIGSSLITNACLCKARTRTASTVETGGYIVIPVSSDRKIVLEKSTNWNGTTNIYMHGYRRIGTNS